jgi:hypothetical protein
MYCTYVHARPNTLDTNGIFYVGKGSDERAQYKLGRNQYHTNIVNKYGKDRILVGMIECSSEKIAFSLERGLIKCLRRAGVSLTNQTDGGEGTLGVVVSEQSRKIRSENGKRYWGNSENKERLSKIIREAYAPGSTARVKVSLAVKEALSKPEIKLRHRAGIEKSRTDEVRAKIAETLKQQRASKEYRTLMSMRGKLACATPESKERLSQASKGTIWITDGVIGRRVLPDTPIPAGFRRGKPDGRSKLNRSVGIHHSLLKRTKP